MLGLLTVGSMLSSPLHPQLDTPTSGSLQQYSASIASADATAPLARRTTPRQDFPARTLTGATQRTDYQKRPSVSSWVLFSFPLDPPLTPNACLVPQGRSGPSRGLFPDRAHAPTAAQSGPIPRTPALQSVCGVAIAQPLAEHAPVRLLDDDLPAEERRAK